MRFQLLPLTTSVASLFIQARAAPNPNLGIDTITFKPQDIIQRDVAIIGGGSSGTYAAIRLKDSGKSVILVEKKGRIGGNTETYIDPATGTPIDIGVVIFHDIDVVRKYFQRLNVPTTKLASGGGGEPSLNADFKTGRILNLTSPSPDAVSAAFKKYNEFLEKYPDLNEGMFLPDPVPEDLYIPFGDFIKKYDIEAALETIYNFNPGLGDPLTVPTVEMIKIWGLSLIQQTQSGFLQTAHHNNSELYTSATADLQSSQSLFLNSEVETTERGDENKSVKLVVKTPEGKKLIVAKKLLITIPPKLDILKPFDVGQEEAVLFKEWIDAGYYTGIVKNTGLPDDRGITSREANTPFNLPQFPAVYSVNPSAVKGLHNAYYGTPRTTESFPLSDEKVKAELISGIQKLQQANPGTFNQTEPEFVVFSAHQPFYLQVEADKIKDGFYKKLYALQGKRNTWWTGAAWRAQDSSMLWKFTEEHVLPGLLESC